MNICFITPSVPAHTPGGMELQTLFLARGLAQRGLGVTILSSAHPQGLTRENDQGIEIHYLDSSVPGKPSKFWEHLCLQFFTRLHNQSPFDIIVSTAWGQFLYPIGITRFRLPIIVMMHTSPPTMFLDSLQAQVNGRMENVVKYPRYIVRTLCYHIPGILRLRRVAGVIAVSEWLANRIRREYVLGREKVTVVPNGIDTQRFVPCSYSEKTILRQQHGFSADDLLILSVGRISVSKGIGWLIRALPKVHQNFSNVKLLIAGNGPDSERFHRLAMDLEIDKSVHFLGAVDQAKLLQYFQMSDLFINPTMLRETFSLSIAEALACGVPVIATKSGAIPSWLCNGEDAVLIEKSDLDLLHLPIIELLKNSELAHRLASSGREKIMRQYTLQQMVDRALKVLVATVHKLSSY